MASDTPGGSADRRTGGSRRLFGLLSASGQLRATEWRLRLGGTAVSILAHLVALALLVALYRPHPPERRVTLIPLDVGEPEVPFVMLIPPPESLRAQRAERRQVALPVAPEVADVPPVMVARAERRDSAAAPATGPTPRVRSRIGPGFGDGRLWIPPVDVLRLGRVLPGEPSVGVAGRGGGAGGAAQLDSLLTQRLLAYLDSLPPDSFATPPPPQWTTEIAGKTWGIDGRWIYLGGLKLPAALLALLPLSQDAAASYDRAKAAADLQRMREDILQAARRADNAAEFKRYVEELRKRRDAEREMRRRVARDTIIP
jgi:hypothetical protein